MQVMSVGKSKQKHSLKSGSEPTCSQPNEFDKINSFGKSSRHIIFIKCHTKIQEQTIHDLKSMLMFTPVIYASDC